MARVSPTDLKAFIRADYEAAAPGWERYMGPTFRVPAERLVADLAPRRGDRCLDLACGSALIARAFAARVGPGLVSACDLSPAQVEQSRGIVAGAGLAGIDLRVMDAEHLAYPPASFDRVGCGFGVNHFPRPMAALRGVLRVLAPGGRAGFTVWAGKPHRIRVRFDERLLELVPALQGHAETSCEDELTRVVTRNSEPERLAAMLTRAGYVRVERRTHRFAADYVDAPSFVDAMLARAARDLERAQLDDAARAGLREALIAEFSSAPRHAFVARRIYHALIGRRQPSGSAAKSPVQVA